MASLPPKTPETLTGLERAIVLLGARTTADLTKSRRKELVELVGAYPDAAAALSWKTALKPLRDDEIFRPAR